MSGCWRRRWVYVMRDQGVQLQHYQQALAHSLLAEAEPGQHEVLHAMTGASHRQVARNQMALRIYRNNVTVSLTRALAAQFPVTARLVGEQFFGALARDYLRQHPPEAAALAFYGHLLPAFIRQSPECAALPYLADVAALEFMCQQALHARDEPVLDAGVLSCLDYSELERLRLLPSASAGILVSPYPVGHIREENLKAEPGEIRLLSADASACRLLVYRAAHTVRVVSLSAAAHALLSRLVAGEALLPAWEAAVQEQQLEFNELPPLLAWLLGLGVFARFTTENAQE